jgi:hypothetical protein
MTYWDEFGLILIQRSDGTLLAVAGCRETAIRLASYFHNKDK